MSDQHDRYFDARIETLPPEQLRKLQDHRLRWQFRRCWDGSDWYRARFEAAGLTPETFGGLADLTRLPLLSDAELAGVPTEAWLVAPPQWVWRKILQPFPSLRCVTDGDNVQTGQRQGRAAWACVKWSEDDSWPVAFYTEKAHLRHVWPAWLKSNRRARTNDLHIGGIDGFLAYECAERQGSHWVDDHLLVEVIDRRSGQQVPDGTAGELVVTDLVREANPLIRYRTGRRSVLTSEQCACGRTSSRIWTGRSLRRAQITTA
jgi:hypothetical protein